MNKISLKKENISIVSSFRASLRYFWDTGIHQVCRRRAWILEKISMGKLWNLLKCLISFWKTNVSHFPILIKIDITPNCQLSCPVCIHGTGKDTKESYGFKNKNMSWKLFDKITSEASNKTSALSFHFLGEPFMYKDITKAVKLASKKRFSTLIASNFSFNFSRDKLWEIVNSGLSSLQVCIDGITQETFNRTRVGGRLDLVLKNLEAVQDFKATTKKKYPLVEIQYLKYPHNAHQAFEIKELAESLKVDSLYETDGGTTSWMETQATKIGNSPKKGTFPKCFWPWTSMLSLYNGDVIPCCYYRYDKLYIEEEQKKFIMGNLNDKSVMEIWNGEIYQKTREFVLNPSKFDGAEDLFCHGCPILYDESSTNCVSRSVKDINC